MPKAINLTSQPEFRWFDKNFMAFYCSDGTDLKLSLLIRPAACGSSSDEAGFTCLSTEL